MSATKFKVGDLAITTNFDINGGTEERLGQMVHIVRVHSDGGDFGDGYYSVIFADGAFYCLEDSELERAHLDLDPLNTRIQSYCEQVLNGT